MTAFIITVTYNNLKTSVYISWKIWRSCVVKSRSAQCVQHGTYVTNPRQTRTFNCMCGGIYGVPVHACTQRVMQTAHLLYLGKCIWSEQEASATLTCNEPSWLPWLQAFSSCYWPMLLWWPVINSPRGFSLAACPRIVMSSHVAMLQ